MNVFDLSAIIRLDSTEYESKLSGLANMTSSAAKIGGMAFGAATAAVGAFAASSIETGKAFDKAMSQVQATMLKSDEEMKSEIGSVSTAYGDFSGNLREFAQFLGENTAFSATQAAEALNYMALAGYTTQESMTMLPNVLSLAAAGDMDLARASDMVTDTQTAFGLSAERTSQMVDEMAKAASTGNTSVEQLGDAFLVVGGLAQELNGGFVTLADGTQAPVDGIQEMEIALTAMANAGIKGSEAGTHMRNMITKLANPTKDGADWMATLGVNVFDTEGKMRSLGDIFGDLSTSMEDLTQEQKIQAISEMFNARDLSSAEAMLAAIESDWDEIGASILEADGSAAKMANIQLDNLAGDMTLFQSALEGAQIAVSDKLTPVFRKFVQFGTKGLSELTKAFKEGGVSGAMQAFSRILSEGLQMLIAGIPEFLSIGAQLLVAVGQGIVGAIPALVPAFGELITTLADAVIEGFPAVSEGFQTMFDDLGTFFSDSLPQFLANGASLVESVASGIISNIPAAVSGFYDLVSSGINYLLENMPSFLERGAEMISNIANGILEAIPEMAGAMGGGVSGIINNIADQLPDFLDKGVDMILHIISGIAERAPEAATSMGEAITSIVTTIMDRLPEFLDKGLEIIANLGSGIIDNVPLIVAAMASALISVIFEIANHLPEFLEKGLELIGKVAAGLIQGVPDLLGKIPGILSDIAHSFTSYDWLSVGKNIIDGIANGIKNFAGNIVSAAKNAASDAFNAAKHALGISSPSKLFKNEVGKRITEGWAMGIESGIPMVVGAIDDTNDEMLDNIDDIGYDTSTMVRSTGSSASSMENARLLDAMRYVAQSIEYMNEGLEGKLEGAFGGVSLSINRREFGRLVRDVRIV